MRVTPFISGLHSVTASELAIRAIVTAVLLLVSAGAVAQISTPPRATANYANAVGFGLSYGEQQDKDADFWGWSAEYSRLVSSSWMGALSLTWDEETERFVDRPNKVVRTYALVGTISYNLTPRFSVTTGLAQDIADDDNASGSMKLKSGDISTGLSLGYSWPLSRRNSLGASFAYEYNLSENEPSISVDVALGWSF